MPNHDEDLKEIAMKHFAGVTDKQIEKELLKMSNLYEEKQEARRERYLARAEKARQESLDHYNASSRAVEHIPLGQPIIVGHHSEKRHRADLKRCHNHMNKSCEAQAKAEHYERKAAGVGKGGISSDDPEAIEKLKAKLEVLQANQETMKAANKIVKSKKLTKDEKLQKLLTELTLDLTMASELLEPDFCGRVGFPSYALQNNNGNMKRIKDRIAHLERQSNQETTEIKIGEVKIIQNTEDNRTQVFFPGKPSEDIRRELKAYGFRWSKYNGCWQRHLSEAALYHAKRIAEKGE